MWGHDDPGVTMSQASPSGGHGSEGAAGAGPSLSSEASFVQFFNSRYAWSDSLIDCLTIAGIGTRFARGWHRLSTQEVWLFSAYIAAVLCHMLWRWLSPRAYHRWRHISGTALQLWASCTPLFWRRRIQGLGKLPASEVAGFPSFQSALAAARVLLVSSYTLQLTVYGMGRPAPLWLKLPAHALSVGMTASHVPAMCRSATFTQPATAQWLGGVYRAWRGAASLLPLPLSPLLPDPSDHAACAAVVTFVHLVLGFVLPMMVAAAAELKARQAHALLAPQYRRSWRRQKRRPWWRLAAWLCSGQGFFHSTAANVAAVLVAAAALWDVVVAVRGGSRGGGEPQGTLP